jgi:rRNA-processing protein FCF1
MIRSMMDCLLAKCVPCITDCVMGELEKLGGKYKIALRLAKDPRMERIPCHCKGCYADDCIVNMVTNWKCFIVATCDKELRGRVRKIPGVPCMYISGYRYTVRILYSTATMLSVFQSSFSLTLRSLVVHRLNACQRPLERLDSMLCGAISVVVSEPSDERLEDNAKVFP